MIEDQAISSSDLRLSIQTGTGTPPAARAYIVFSTAFGTPPDVYVTNIGPFGRTSGTLVGLDRNDPRIV